MKKLLSFAVAAVMVPCLFSCNRDVSETQNVTETQKPQEYTITVADHFPIENELKQSYQPGEEVTIKIGTITEGYYTRFVNGEEQSQDADSDFEYTYFTFIMPDTDVIIEFEEHWVDIPEAPEE